MGENYYDILEVSKDADEETIKKAYKRLSLKWHPDKNVDNQEVAGEKFKKISEAYNILKDGDKRRRYDLHGTADERQPQMNPNDIFNQMFGGGFGGFGGFNGFHFENNFGFNININGRNFSTNGPQPKKQNSPDKTIEVKLTISEMMNGVEKNIQVIRKVKCEGCGGCGMKDKNKNPNCGTCNGAGVQRVIRRISLNEIMQQTVTCSGCGGSGKIIKEEDKCTECRGDKFVQEVRIISVHIPKGIKNNECVAVHNLSDETEDSISAGSLIIRFIEESTESMRRDGYNLLVKKNILLSEALSGLYIIFKHPNGESIIIESDDVIKPGSRYRIKGLGFWNKEINNYGDLIFDLEIIFPDVIENNRKELIRKLLPRRKQDSIDADKFKIELMEDNVKHHKNEKVDYSDDKEFEEYFSNLKIFK